MIMLITAFAITVHPTQLLGGPVPKKISLDEAIRMAKLNNHDYKIAVYRQKADNEKVNQAWGMLYPIISSEASLLRQGADSGFMSVSEGQYDIKIVQLNFGLNPGIFYNTLQMSRKAYVVSTEEVKRIKSEIESNIIQSYFNIILAEEMISITKDTIQLLQENLKDVTSMYKTGSVPRYDLLQAQVQLKSQKPLLLDAENKYRNALDMFNYLLGLDEKLYMPDRSMIDQDAYRIAENDIDSFVHRVGGVAMKNRPEVVQLQMQKEIAEHNKNINSSYYLWPTFTAGGFYGYTKPLPTIGEIPFPTSNGVGVLDLSRIAGTNKWQPNWQVRVAATYRWGSLIPLDPTRAQEREQKEHMLEAEEELSNLKRLITIAIKSDYSSLITSYQIIFSQKENVESAKEGLRIARESYRAGVIKNSELFAAQVQLTQARSGYINAVNNYYQSLARLRKDIGVEDERTIFGGTDHE